MSDIDTPLKLPGDSSPYWIYHELEIRQWLLELAKLKERVQLWYGGNDLLVSLVLDVLPDGTLLLDVGADPKANQQLLKRDRVVLVGKIDGVEMKAALGPLTLGEQGGLPSFVGRLPERLHRLQRREFHRLPIPVGTEVRCSVAWQDHHTATAQSRRRMQLDVADLSLGGLCVWKPTVGNWSPSVGDRLTDCRLSLPDDEDPLDTELSVRHVTVMHSRSGRPRTRVGCQFVHMARGADIRLQRLLMQLELSCRPATP